MPGTGPAWSCCSALPACAPFPTTITAPRASTAPTPGPVFRYIQLPKLRLVLLIAVLLRFMDSFIIYTEPYVVTRGGPGVSTIFLSHALVQTATVQFNLGEAGRHVGDLFPDHPLRVLGLFRADRAARRGPAEGQCQLNHELLLRARRSIVVLLMVPVYWLVHHEPEKSIAEISELLHASIRMRPPRRTSSYHPGRSELVLRLCQRQ